MKKGQNHRHVLVVRQDVVHEQRNVVDTICFDGYTSTPDKRHANSNCLPIRLQPGEKALVLKVELLYCTNDTDYEWRFELQGELWDGQATPLQIVVPPHAKGVVPSLDRLVYRNEVVAKGSEFFQYIGQEHAILGAHSTCVSPNAECQLFEEKDPFLQFLRQHWSTFSGLTASDIHLINKEEKEEDHIYQVSQNAIDRATRFFKTLFGKIKYKTTETPISIIRTNGKKEEEVAASAAFSGVVIMLSLDYVAVAPAAPKCRIMDYPLNLII